MGAYRALIKADTIAKRMRLLLQDYFEEADKTLELIAEDSDDEYVKRINWLINYALIPEDVRNLIYLNFVYNVKFGSFHYYMFPELPENVVEENDKGIAKVNYDLLTEYLIRVFIPITIKDQIWIWNGEIWKEDEGEIENAITFILKDKGISSDRKIKDTVGEIVSRIKWLTLCYEFPFNKLGSRFIPLKNGVLYRGDIQVLLPNGPAFGFTYRIPVNYNKDAQCPKIEKFLSEIVEPQDLPLLYEIPALALLQNPWYQTHYLLIGEGANGKSTYLKLLETFLGKENVAHISLQDLCNDKFMAAELVGKLANIYADLPKNAVANSGRFKILTGGDRVYVQKKFKNPFPFENKAVMVFSANEPPKITDKTYAFWRRWVIIKFPNEFPPNPNLIFELTTEEELSGFLNKVLEAMTRIELVGVTRTDTAEQIKEEWLKRANSVYAFISECIERDAQSYELKETVYNTYLQFCEIYDFEPLSKHKFTPEFQRLSKATLSQKRFAGKREWVWFGVRLKEIQFEEQEEESGTLEEFFDERSMFEEFLEGDGL